MGWICSPICWMPSASQIIVFFFCFLLLLGSDPLGGHGSVMLQVMLSPAEGRTAAPKPNSLGSSTAQGRPPTARTPCQREAHSPQQPWSCSSPFFPSPASPNPQLCRTGWVQLCCASFPRTALPARTPPHPNGPSLFFPLFFFFPGSKLPPLPVLQTLFSSR